MKKLLNGHVLLIGFLFIIIMMMCSGPLFAQPNTEKQTRKERRKEPPTIEERLSKLTEKLSLTESQAGDIEKIMIETKAEIDTIRDDKTKSKEEKRAAKEAVRTDHNAKVKMLLTDEQAAKFEKMLAKRKERREDREKNRADRTDKKSRKESK